MSQSPKDLGECREVFDCIIGLYKGVAFMAVPRPFNTIVDDSGRDGPKRYAVREHSSAKYIQGGNPQPRNGKVIG